MTRTARVLGVVAIALVVVGGALAYSGSRSHRRSRFEAHLPTASTIAEGGVVVGRMHISGGPRARNGAMPDEPLPGVVEVHHPRDPVVLLRVGVGVTGSFRIDLPIGDYQLVGRPANTGIDAFRSQDFRIDAAHTTAVDLVDVAT
jgi:hypothetical protein